jgi:hypothetical protein
MAAALWNMHGWINIWKKLRTPTKHSPKSFNCTSMILKPEETRRMELFQTKEVQSHQQSFFPLKHRSQLWKCSKTPAAHTGCLVILVKSITRLLRCTFVFHTKICSQIINIFHYYETFCFYITTLIYRYWIANKIFKNHIFLFNWCKKEFALMMR